MTAPALHLDTPLADALRRLLASLSGQLEVPRRITTYLAGGMAVHLYTGKRVTQDVDTEFAARIPLPPGLTVPVHDPASPPRALFIDTGYNPMFSLLHPDYQDDALKVPVDTGMIELRVLTPLDLAVSKLSRFAAIDREDIRDLVGLGLVTADALLARATQALEGYIGNCSQVESNLRVAVRDARAIQAADAAKAPPGLAPR